MPVESRNVSLRHARFLGPRPTTPHTRKVASGFGQDDCEALTTGTAVSVSVVISLTSCDFFPTQNTLVFILWTEKMFPARVDPSTVNTIAILRLVISRKGRHRANTRKPPLHAMTTTWWRLIQRFTAASLINSGLTGFPRAQVNNLSISALVGFGDSGKGSRFRASSFREKVLHLFNMSCMLQRVAGAPPGCS